MVEEKRSQFTEIDVEHINIVDKNGNPVPMWYVDVEKQKYISNPCGTLSTAFWKKDYFNVPDGIEITHENTTDSVNCKSRKSTRYFRLIHYPLTE